MFRIDEDRRADPSVPVRRGGGRSTVRKLRCCLALAAILAAQGCSSSTANPRADAQPGPGLLVEALRITENGSASPDADAAGCRGFVLDAGTVRQVLEASESISRDQYMHGLPWSPCLVRGRVTLADGRQATWTIRQYGTGSVLLDGGGERFLWCRTCTRPPFVPIE
jgi:hypothetical protein